MKSNLLASTLFLLAMSLATAPSLASSNGDQGRLVPVGEWLFSGAVGYGQMTSHLTDKDDIPLYVLPDIRYYGEKFSLENLNLAYSLADTNAYTFDIIGEQNLDGFYFPGGYHDTVALFTGKPGIGFIEDDPLPPPDPSHRSTSYMAGFEYKQYGFVDVSFTHVWDISNVHNGSESRIELAHLLTWEPLNVEIKMGVAYKSQKMMNYYYGYEDPINVYVESIYVPEASLSKHVSVNLGYRLSPKWLAVAMYRHQWFDKHIANSPVVLEDHNSSYFVGFKRLFF